MVNLAIIIGRVGRDPETRNAGTSKVSTFSLAISEKYKDKETTTWLNIVAWGKLADIVSQYVHKGDALYIEGKIQTREYDGKDGQKKKAFEIVARSIQMLGGKKQDGQGTGRENKSDDFPPENDDIPL